MRQEEVRQLATWQEFTVYVRSRYNVVDAHPDGTALQFEFPTAGGRSQLMYLSRHTLARGSEEWALIESPIGEFDQIDMRAALKSVEDYAFGGLGMLQDSIVSIRHGFPLRDFDVNEFERPFQILVGTADSLERLLTNRDEF